MAEVSSQKVLAALKVSRDDEGTMVHVAGCWHARLWQRVDHAGRLWYTGVLWNDDHGLGADMTRPVMSAGRGGNSDNVMTQLAHGLAKAVNRDIWPKGPDESIRDWYGRVCPTDEAMARQLDDVPFYEYMASVAAAGDYYVCGVSDSVVRQRLTAGLAHAMRCHDAFVYDLEELGRLPRAFRSYRSDVGPSVLPADR